MLIITAFFIWKASELEKYGNVVQAWVTVALLLVTAAYVSSVKRQTDASIKMAKEMEKQRYGSVRPIIDFRRATADDLASPDQRQTESRVGRLMCKSLLLPKDTLEGSPLILCNIGMGPAIDLNLIIQNQNGSTRSNHSYYGTLAKDAETATRDLNLGQLRDHDTIVATYKDIYEHCFESVAKVIVDDQKGIMVSPTKTRPIKTKTEESQKALENKQ